MPYKEPLDLYQEWERLYRKDRPDQIHFDYDRQRQGHTLEEIDHYTQRQVAAKAHKRTIPKKLR